MSEGTRVGAEMTFIEKRLRPTPVFFLVLFRHALESRLKLVLKILPGDPVKTRVVQVTKNLEEL